MPSKRRVTGSLWSSLLLLLVAASALAAPAPGSGAVTAGAGGRAVVLGWGFETPDALAVSDGHLFVANGGADSVVELTAATRHYVRTIFGPQYQLDDPFAEVVSGGDLFVADYDGNSV